MPFKLRRLKFIYQVGQDFRFDEKPEVDWENDRAPPNASRGYNFSGVFFDGESDETKIKYAHACA